MRLIRFAVLLAAATAVPLAAAPAKPYYAAAVAYSGRNPDDVKLDASRHPAEILAFMGLRSGMKALDVLTGSGYYAELMARVVGPRGHVTAFEHDGFTDDKTKAMFAAMSTREPNLTFKADGPLSAFAFPPASFDFAMIHLNYHDFYWTSDQYRFPRVEPDQLLARLFTAMKPGGIVAIVDHAGPAGDTRAIVEKMHRIDPETVKADFLRAGFVLDGTSDLLRNPSDDHTLAVFKPEIRGKTDRFAFRFKKPR